MSLMQFIRIFWARRWLIIAATASTLIGALIVTSLLPPRWDASARVMLNLMKPDPVTGEVVGAIGGRVYAQTQIELITDYGVAGQVAEQLGWLSDPNLIARYQKRSKADQRDFRSWLAQIIIDGTKAKLVQDSNILEITYTGTSAASAKAVADTLRKVYIDDSLITRRADAEKNAEWYEQQAAKAKIALDDAVNTETTYERANGVVMANDKVDVETQRLQVLSASSGVPSATPVVPQTVPADIELAQADSQLASAAKILGPNNPEMQALRSRRSAIATAAAQEHATARALAGGAASGSGALDRAMAAQKSRILADSTKIGHLQVLQNDVNLRRDVLEKLSGRAAQFRQEALVSDPGITPLGVPSTPKGASFPNYILIIPGALFLGAAIGIMVALLMELLARRVRGVEDLSSLADLPLIGVIGAPARRGGWGPRRILSRLKNGLPGRKTVTA